MNLPSILTALYTINFAQVAPPVFTPAAGSYTSALTVSMTSSTTGTLIRYTTDGSTHTSSYGIIGTSVAVTDTMTLKAIAYDPLMVLANSPVTSGIYTIAPRITSITPNKGPNTAPVFVTIKGKNFKPGITARLSLTAQPDIIGAGLVLVDSTTITCIFDHRGVPDTMGPERG